MPTNKRTITAVDGILRFTQNDRYTRHPERSLPAGRQVKDPSAFSTMTLKMVAANFF